VGHSFDHLKERLSQPARHIVSRFPLSKVGYPSEGLPGGVAMTSAVALIAELRVF
jgi:hypothetical protein